MGKENVGFDEDSCGLDWIESSLDFDDNKKRLKPSVDVGVGYLWNSVESRLLKGKLSGFESGGGGVVVEHNIEEELDVLLTLCASQDEEEKLKEVFNSDVGDIILVECPLCGVDISNLSEEQRHVRTNECLDKGVVHEKQPQAAAQLQQDAIVENDGLSPVVKWLRTLGLEKYEGAFVYEEVDWDTLHWLTEEDLIGIGISTLVPRKKLVYALNELRKERAQAVETRQTDEHVGGRSETKTIGDKIRLVRIFLNIL